MLVRNYLVLVALLAALAAGCGSDRARWHGPASADAAEDLGLVDTTVDVPDLRVDLPLEITDILDAAPEVVDMIPDPGPELIDATDATDADAEIADLADGEVCTPDCAGKECGSDGCGGSCGVCPANKPYCNMAFQCEACEPDCEGKTCGGDGCGGSCGACPVGWACLSGSCDPPECAGDVILYEEDFSECNEGAITVVDDQPDDPVTWMAMEDGALSGPCALHFGDPVGGTYDTGDPVSAALVLPWITVPDDGDPYLVRFALRMDAEPVVAPEYPYDHDVLHLRAYGEGLPEEGAALFNSKEFLNNTDGAWVLVAASLDAYAGLDIQLRFEFDTIDSAANDYEGIWLDDLRVGTACPLCFLDEDCVDDEPCLQDLCVLFSNQGVIGTCGHLPKEPCCVGLDPSFCDDLDPCTEDSCDLVTGDCVHVVIEDCGS